LPPRGPISDCPAVGKGKVKRSRQLDDKGGEVAGHEGGQDFVKCREGQEGSYKKKPLGRRGDMLGNSPKDYKLLCLRQETRGGDGSPTREGGHFLALRTNNRMART